MYVLIIVLVLLFGFVVTWTSHRNLTISIDSIAVNEKELLQESHLLQKIVKKQASQIYHFAQFGKIASGIFHDLMNPLTAIAINIENIQPKTYSEVKAHRHIEKAISASKRMEILLHSVKKHLKVEGLERKFNPIDEVHAAVSLLHSKIQKNHIIVSIHANPAPLFLFGNPIRLHQVILNLISNAIDSYDVKGYQKENPIYVSLQYADSTLTLSIADKGCGINEEIQAHIFDSFFTTKSEDQGTGIGLSTVKDIVEQDLKGTINFTTVLHEGSTFTVTIPMLS